MTAANEEALRTALVQAIEGAGFAVAGPTDVRAAEHGEPAWVCHGRAVLAETACTLKAMEALKLAEAFDAEEGGDEPAEQIPLQQRLVAAGLYHVRDDANMRSGEDAKRFVNHQVVCFLFEDNSRLVKFMHWSYPPEESKWAVIPSATA